MTFYAVFLWPAVMVSGDHQVRSTNTVHKGKTRHDTDSDKADPQAQMILAPNSYRYLVSQWLFRRKTGQLSTRRRSICIISHGRRTAAARSSSSSQCGFGWARPRRG